MENSGEQRIRVRISPEDAGGIGASPVVAQEVPLRTLVGWVVSVTGKDAARIEGILKRGSFVKSLSRIRWEPLAAGEALDRILAALPGDWPERPFAAEAVREVVVVAGRREFVIAGKIARGKRWFRGKSFLQCWLESEQLPRPAYQRYDYEEKADRFAAPVPASALDSAREAFELLPARPLRVALRQVALTGNAFLLPREE
jgi:hypothetical protein